MRSARACRWGIAMGSDITHTEWMREYERRRSDLYNAAYDVGDARNGEEEERAEAVAAMARKALDAHVRGLVEENERLRRELREIARWCESHGHPESRAPNATTETQRNWAFTVIAEMGKRARNALAAPKDAP